MVSVLHLRLFVASPSSWLVTSFNGLFTSCVIYALCLIWCWAYHGMTASKPLYNLARVFYPYWMGHQWRHILIRTTYASSVEIAAVMLQGQGGGLPPLSYMARKLNQAERGNTSSVYDLEALAICEAVKHWRCYLEGCSKFLVVIDHDTLRHPLSQPNNMLNKRQARCLRDLHPFVGSMTLAYRNGAMNEADTLSRRPYFVPHSHNFNILGWRGSVMSRIKTEVLAVVRIRTFKLTDI
jgi:hypothetical protein